MRIESACLGALATNCYLIEKDSRRLLIDPGDSGPALDALIAERKIDWVINTHGHFDHVGGSWSLPGVPVAMHRGDLDYAEQAVPGHPPVDRYLEDGDEIIPGFVVLHVPGHSLGSIALLADGVLVVGDLLFAGSIGRTDFPGGSPNDMRRSLQRIVALPGDYRVLPGHGEETTLDRERRNNPFLLHLV